MGGGGGGGGSSSSGRLIKLGTAMTVIFLVTLLALLAQLFYLLWRRRVYRRQAATGGGARDAADNLSIHSSSESSFSSLELLYFFCMRPHSDSTTGNDNRSSDRQVEMEVVDIDLQKLREMFGPPGFLFTIKEEEREGFNSPADKSLHSADKAAKKIDGELCRNIRNVSLEECFKAADSVVEMEVDGGGGDDATPFSTPCASPAFFTPSASPFQDDVNLRVMEEGRICSESKTAPLVRSEE